MNDFQKLRSQTMIQKKLNSLLICRKITDDHIDLKGFLSQHKMQKNMKPKDLY